jgi:HPt (histidine-containing phosphotransfer) domain-containing protein
MNPLEELRAEYRAELPAKLAHLKTLLKQRSYGDLQRALHTLAGSAGTFGLPAVGEAAREAEACCASGDTARLAALIDAIGSKAASAP